jgi:hypothetical protein
MPRLSTVPNITSTFVNLSPKRLSISSFVLSVRFLQPSGEAAMRRAIGAGLRGGLNFQRFLDGV